MMCLGANRMSLFSDTRPEAEQVLVPLLRQATLCRKLQMVGETSC